MIPLNKRFGPQFRILHSCTDQAATNALAQMGLTASQGHIMCYLSRSPQPPCAHDIEEAFQLSHPTVSGLLCRLEKKGFIALRPDPDDKRRKRIYILPRGEACNQHMHESISAIEAQLVQGFTDREREQFLGLLERAINNMGGAPHSPKCKEEPCK